MIDGTSPLIDAYWASEEPDHHGSESDPKVDEAKAKLGAFFAQNSKQVFFEQQLKVILEDEFFHWVTTRALRLLVAQGHLATDLVVSKPFSVRFYRMPDHRYWKRQAREILALIAEYSAPSFTGPLGQHGELMFDAAFPTAGFLPTGRDVTSFGGRTWTKSGEDLDRCFTRDGITYGAEIKNTLSYIPREELTSKLEMCAFLGLRPLFIARMHPKSYIEEIREAGGYALVFKWQLYPLGSADLARRVRERLGLTVDCPKAIAEGTVKRFLNWHLKTLSGTS